MGEVLKFVTPYGGLKKNARKILRVLQKQLNFKTTSGEFRFEIPVLSSAIRAQNKHEKNWRAQAKLLGILFNGIMRKAKKRT